jgi:hypothetical protein
MIAARQSREARRTLITRRTRLPKKVVAIGPVVLAAQHTTALEIFDQTRMGRDHCGRVSPKAPSLHPRLDRHV